MRIYLGLAAKEDIDIITKLNEIRSDVGVEISAYYHKTKSSTRKIAKTCADEEIPLIIDSGAVQTYRLGTKNINDDYLRDLYKKLNPDFLFAPDVLGIPQKTFEIQLDFIKQNDDLELLAPLQNINYGPIFQKQIIDEIKILQEHGYSKFGFGRPYATKMTRRQSVMYYGPMLRPYVEHLHYLAIPLGVGVAGTNFLDSCDVGLHFLKMKYRYQVWKNIEETVRVLNNLIEVEQTLRQIRQKQAQIATKPEGGRDE